jgi:hypothetical protein
VDKVAADELLAFVNLSAVHLSADGPGKHQIDFE